MSSPPINTTKPAMAYSGPKTATVSAATSAASEEQTACDVGRAAVRAIQGSFDAVKHRLREVSNHRKPIIPSTRQLIETKPSRDPFPQAQLRCARKQVSLPAHYRTVTVPKSTRPSAVGGSSGRFCNSSGWYMPARMPTSPDRPAGSGTRCRSTMTSPARQRVVGVKPPTGSPSLADHRPSMPSAWTKTL